MSICASRQFPFPLCLTAINDFSLPRSNSFVLWPASRRTICLTSRPPSSSLGIVSATFFLHHERYHLLLSSWPLSPSFGLASAITAYYFMGFEAAPLRATIPLIWPHRRTTPRDIITYLGSPPHLSGDFIWADSQAPLPHWVLDELIGCLFSLDHRRPSSGTSRRIYLHSQTPILNLCCPSLGSQGVNRTALGPIFFSFHTHFALLSQHSLQTFCQACSYGCKHNTSVLPLDKMLPCFDLVGGSSRLLLWSMLVLLLLQRRVTNSLHFFSDTHSLWWRATL